MKSAAILATSAEYNNPLRLNSATKFYNPVGPGFSLRRTESYGYDQDFDYLTSVNYGDSLAVQTWEFDSAGNRPSASANPGTWSYDNLNRMTAFQLYDCHGNMVATLARSGLGFTTSNVRTYDVWGGVRKGAPTGGGMLRTLVMFRMMREA